MPETLNFEEFEALLKDAYMNGAEHALYNFAAPKDDPKYKPKDFGDYMLELTVKAKSTGTVKK